MRIAFLADINSTNFRNFLKYFEDIGANFIVISTNAPLKKLNFNIISLPTLLPRNKTFIKEYKKNDTRFSFASIIISIAHKYGFIKLLWDLWQEARIVNVPYQCFFARKAFLEFKPDIVFAYRTQNEGYIAALTGYSKKIVLFTQGADFIYASKSTFINSLLTKFTLKRTSLLVSDCKRDIKLAHEFGYDKAKKSLLIPGNGGVDYLTFNSGLKIKNRRKIIFCPRPPTPYIQHINLIIALNSFFSNSLSRDFSCIMICTTSQKFMLENLITKYSNYNYLIKVFDFMDRKEMASKLRESLIMISPSTIDGTPNSLLESMACGCIPVVSNLDSIQEWIKNDINGYLFDPKSACDMYSSLKRAILNYDGLEKIQEMNYKIISEKANYKNRMPVLFKALEDLVID